MLEFRLSFGPKRHICYCFVTEIARRDKYEKDEGQRILTGKCTTVLCCMLEYIVQIAETHKSCACFQHANTTKYST